MASVIYKKVDGKVISQLVDIQFLAQELEFGGWSTNPKCVEVVTKEEADTNESGKLSVDEIRAAAKEAGIEGYDKKRIKTLESELWPSSK